MNLSHIRTLIWLRWRLTLASLRRAGIVTRAILAILAVGLVLVSIGGFAAAILLGSYLLPQAKPNHLMLLWDIVAVGFLFFWGIGFMSELQRSEPIAMEKLLHLPLSLRGAFLLNYLSSFASLTIVCLLPTILGLCVALPWALGPRLLVIWPLVAGFLLLVTSLTFQVRGWLATLIANPRRRRTVIAITTTIFILIMQIPNMGQLWVRRLLEAEQKRVAAEREALLAPLDVRLAGQELTAAQRVALEETRTKMSEEFDQQLEAIEAAHWQKARSWIVTAHKFIPFAWLPYGIQQAALGKVWPGVLGALGMTSLAAISLRQSYRSTLRHYRHADSARPLRRSKRFRQKTRGPRNALSKPFPWAPTIPANIARQNWCSLLRAPEVRMQLIGPVMVLLMLALVLGSQRKDVSTALSPLLATGLILMTAVTCTNLLWNQFGFDRQAFRCYVLLPVSGQDLLLGKNLSVAAICGPILLMAIVAVFFFLPIKWVDLLACLPTGISILLIMLMIGNYLSTRFPMPVSAHSIRKTRMRWQTVLAHLAVTFFFLPLLMTVPTAPMGIQAACRYFGVLPWFPVGLTLALFVCGLVTWVYWQLLPVAGGFVERRKRDILLEVTRAED